jgi:DNA mismatch endonuclease (patch repair protein)
VAVFCDGDSWHGWNWRRQKAKLARGNNGAYWIRKIERNMERDAQVDRALRELGWRPLRFWEHEIRTDAGAAAVLEIAAALGRA